MTPAWAQRQEELRRDCVVSRKVKKPKHPLPTEVTAPLSVLLVLISTWLYPILTRKFRDRCGGSKTYGVEETAGVYYWIGRSGAAASQRVLGDGESYAAQPAPRPRTTDRR